MSTITKKRKKVRKPIAVKRNGRIHVRNQWVNAEPSSSLTRNDLRPQKSPTLKRAENFGEEMIKHGNVGVTVIDLDSDTFLLTANGQEYELSIQDGEYMIEGEPVDQHDFALSCSRRN